jgi:hypothetical protein
MQVHDSAGKEAVGRFDEGSVRRDINEQHLMAGPDVGRQDPMILEETTPAGLAPFGPASGHSAVQR